MKRFLRSLAPVLLLAVPTRPAAAAWPAGGATSADDPIVKAVVTFQEKSRGAVSVDQLQAAAAEALAGLSIARLSVAQIERLGVIVQYAPLAPQARFSARLDELARPPGPDGAMAAVLRALAVPPPATANAAARAAYVKEKAARIVAAAGHDGFGEALAAGRGELLYLQAASLGPRNIWSSGVGAALVAHLSPDLPIRNIDDLSMLGKFTDLALAAEGGDPATREKLRTTMIAVLDRTIADPRVSVSQRTSLASARDRLDSAAMKGRLIGHAAPPLAFTWASDGRLKSLADLKGKVVVLEFWTTGIQPGIASFPRLRQLAARYKDAPVVVLGATSLQGYFVARKLNDPAARRIDTTGDPNKETDLMPGFMKDMEMTWPVVFTSQSAFNPAYGVVALPHLTIIDPAGIVRYNELRPADATLEEKIDGLLKEANLNMPDVASPAAKTAK